MWETVATRAGQRAFARLFMHAVENSTFVRVSDECYAFLSGLLVYLLSTPTGHDVPCWLLRVIAVVYRTGAAGAPYHSEHLHIRSMQALQSIQLQPRHMVRRRFSVI